MRIDFLVAKPVELTIAKVLALFVTAFPCRVKMLVNPADYGGFISNL